MMPLHYPQVSPQFGSFSENLYIVLADVGIAMGSGSDIAIGTAKFILMSSNLLPILTLHDLSRTVIRRIKFNFLWYGHGTID
jgi:hypothetical protein